MRNLERSQQLEFSINQTSISELSDMTNTSTMGSLNDLSSIEHVQHQITIAQYNNITTLETYMLSHEHEISNRPATLTTNDCDVQRVMQRHKDMFLRYTSRYNQLIRILSPKRELQCQRLMRNLQIRYKRYQESFLLGITQFQARVQLIKIKEQQQERTRIQNERSQKEREILMNNMQKMRRHIKKPKQQNVVLYQRQEIQVDIKSQKMQIKQIKSSQNQLEFQQIHLDRDKKATGKQKDLQKEENILIRDSKGRGGSNIQNYQREKEQGEEQE